MWKRMWALSVTKFFSNFNDNAFKSVGILLAIETIKDEGEQTALIAFGSMVFMLPFITFPTFAGWLGDRIPKRTILIYAKVAELVKVINGSMKTIDNQNPRHAHPRPPARIPHMQDAGE